MNLVSVIVPILNEGERLKGIFESILQQDISSEHIEIIVVTPKPSAIEQAICDQYQTYLRINYLKSPSYGRAQGLNFAIQQSKGSYICRIDGRSIIPNDYINRMIKILVKKNASVVGGVQRALLCGQNSWQDAIAICMNSPCGAGPSPHRTASRSGPTDAVYLGLYKRQLFEQVGWFDEESAVISEEVDFYTRVRAAGEIVWLDANLIIGYVPRSSLKNQFKLYYRYGGAKIAIAQKYKTLINFRQLIAPGFYAFITFLGLGSLLYMPIFIILFATLLIYILAVTSCATMEAASVKRLSIVPKVALTMVSMHFGYALGYWKKILIKDRPGTYWPG